MKILRVLAVAVALLVIVGLGVGAFLWFYLYGPNKLASEDLVPADTVFFASIPNAAEIATSYETSNLKKVVDSFASSKEGSEVTGYLNQQKDMTDALTVLGENLSGQSFIALTSLDTEHPEKTGVIAAMHPKPGLNTFDDFITKLKKAWPSLLKDASTGKEDINGVSCQWIQGQGAPTKIYVAQVDGWILTSWGADPIKDWLNRAHHKAASPSLAQNPHFQTLLAKVGPKYQTLVYGNLQPMLPSFLKLLSAQSPKQSAYLGEKMKQIGSFAMTTAFEGSEIADRAAFEFPRSAQLDSGLADSPCPYDTLKFTGPNTLLYVASSMDFPRYYKNIEESLEASDHLDTAVDPVKKLHDAVQGLGLDLDKNILQPLGHEVSLQLDWSPDKPLPDLGLMVKVDKADDFQPTITALTKAIQAATQLTAVERELNVGDQHLVVFQPVQSLPISPTLTTNGPYFGVFLTKQYAAACFSREPDLILEKNPNFARQLGSRIKGSQSATFLDTPGLIKRSYDASKPYLSLAASFNPQIADVLDKYPLEDYVNQCGPIGTWSTVTTTDDNKVVTYSVSGIGNQSILLGGAVGVGVYALEASGLTKSIPGLAPQGGTPPAGSGSSAPSADDTSTNTPATNTPAVPSPDTTSTNAPADATQGNGTPTTNSDPATPPSADNK